MARCNSCGAELPDYYTSCPNCGGTSISKAPSPAPSASSGYVPMSEQRVVTSALGWFGWFMLISFVPLIGTIIMLCSTKDPTAKNYAKLTLILQIISLVLCIICIVAFASILTSYVEHSQGYGSLMFLNLL